MHFQQFFDPDYEGHDDLNESRHEFHENLVKVNLKDNWITLRAEGQKVDLYIKKEYFGTIINDPLITVGNVFPVVTFGAADGDLVRVLPVDKENPPKQGAKTSTSPAKTNNAKPAANTTTTTTAKEGAKTAQKEN